MRALEHVTVRQARFLNRVCDAVRNIGDAERLPVGKRDRCGLCTLLRIGVAIRNALEELAGSSGFGIAIQFHDDLLIVLLAIAGTAGNRAMIIVGCAILLQCGGLICAQRDVEREPLRVKIIRFVVTVTHRNLLGERQTGLALILHANHVRTGEYMRQIGILQTETNALPLGAIVLVFGLADLVVCPTGRVDEAVIRHGALIGQRVVAILVVAGPTDVHGLPMFGADGFGPAAIGHTFLIRATQLRDLQIGKRAIDIAIGRELFQHLIQRTDMSHGRDTIIFGAGVCEDAVIGDEQFHQRVIDLITLRCFGFLDVIGAVVQIDATALHTFGRRARHAEHARALHLVRIARIRRDAGLQCGRSLQQARAVRIDLIRGIEAEFRTFHWVTGIIDLLHDRIVVHIGDGDLHAEITQELPAVCARLRSVQTNGVRGIDAFRGIGRGVVHAHGIQRISLFLVGAHEIVGENVTGQAGNRSRILAFGIQAEEMQVVRASGAIRLGQLDDVSHTIHRIGR